MSFTVAAPCNLLFQRQAPARGLAGLGRKLGSAICRKGGFGADVVPVTRTFRGLGTSTVEPRHAGLAASVNMRRKRLGGLSQGGGAPVGLSGRGRAQ
eukprot:1182079-Prorocentrum_minimum.AAC.4